MSVRVIRGTVEPSERDVAVLYCSTSMFAFGPIFESVAQAEEFLLFVEERTRIDPRNLSDKKLEELYAIFRKSTP